jgi:hypothetical protein
VRQHVLLLLLLLLLLLRLTVRCTTRVRRSTGASLSLARLAVVKVRTFRAMSRVDGD